MSEKFEAVKGYYFAGVWPRHRLEGAVGKWITPEEFEQIIAYTHQTLPGDGGA